jgi:hypothetical protein
MRGPPRRKSAYLPFPHNEQRRTVSPTAGEPWNGGGQAFNIRNSINRRGCVRNMPVTTYSTCHHLTKPFNAPHLRLSPPGAVCHHLQNEVVTAGSRRNTGMSLPSPLSPPILRVCMGRKIYAS